MNSDAYKDGYQKGLQDAAKGKKRNYHQFPKLKFLVFGDNVIDTWKAGYEQGYVDGLRKANNIYR